MKKCHLLLLNKAAYWLLFSFILGFSGALFPQEFSLPVNVSRMPDQIDTLPSIAVDKDNHVHIAWNGFYAKAGAPDGVASDIFYSTNISGPFSAPVRIPVAENWYSRDPDIAVDSNGCAHIVFRRSPNQSSITSADDLFYVSNTGGSFCAPQRLARPLSCSAGHPVRSPHPLRQPESHSHNVYRQRFSNYRNEQRERELESAYRCL